MICLSCLFVLGLNLLDSLFLFYSFLSLFSFNSPLFFPPQLYPTLFSSIIECKRKTGYSSIIHTQTTHTRTHTQILICAVEKWKEGAGRKDSQLLHLSSGVHSLAAEHPDYQTQLPIISCLVCEPHYRSIQPSDTVCEVNINANIDSSVILPVCESGIHISVKQESKPTMIFYLGNGGIVSSFPIICWFILFLRWVPIE